MSLRICIAAEHAGVGAAETYAFSLSAELSRRGHRVSLLTFEPNLGGAAHWLEGTDVELRQLPPGTGARAADAGRWIRAERPDVVHVNHATSPVLVAARTHRVPARLVTDHVLPMRPTYGLRGRAWRVATLHSTGAVVVLSRQNASLAVSAWPNRRVFMIHAGVTKPVVGLSRDEARRSFNLPEGAFVASLIGRLSEQKQQAVLIDAIKSLRAEGLDARAIFAGEGEMRPALEKMVKHLDEPEAVILAGYRDDVGTVLAATDVYVQPSAWEGLGFALIEAMASSLPVVVSDIPALREVIDSIGSPVVGVGDAEALSAALSLIRSSPREAERMGRALQARWTSSFTPDRMALGHELAYEALLSG
jgi:glycosyltransferase involved in cell wall biosynthesis